MGSRGRMTIGGVQERLPWLMRPVEALDALVTPSRWRCRLSPGSGAKHVTRIDSTRLAEQLSARVGPLRERLVSGKPACARLDWETRRMVWSVVYAVVVSYGLRPKKPPVPTEGKRINLIAAPESYPDFHAPALVVPDDVPCAEASLPSELLVQGLHLLQDVLPIVASHQPSSSHDPEQRLRGAYGRLYRLVRSPPRWHPELAEAARQQNLLGALAAGGPFAKLLHRSDAGSATPYTIDLRYLAGYEVRPGLAPLGCRINFDAPGGRLVVANVEYGDRAVAPGDMDWEHIERIALCSLVTHLTVWRHGMQYHVAGLAPFAVATHNLPGRHPLRRLLTPHTAETISVNYNTHLTLRRNGYDVTGFSFPREVIFRYYDDGARAFDLNFLDLRADAERRGIGDDLRYPYLPLALRYYDLVEAYAAEYVDHYYDDAAVEKDEGLQAWFEELDRTLLKGVRYFAPSLTKANLVRLCTAFIYGVTVEHEQNTMWDYAVFLPSSVRADGRPQSVGEVQNVVNFQLLISSATNRLLDDVGHLALDDGAARIMRDFRSSLRELQTELEAGGDHYWVVYPEDLEASVSA